MEYGSWTTYDKILHNGTLAYWRAKVAGGASCPACFDDGLLTFPASEPVEAPEDRTWVCPLCNEFSELP